MGNFAQKMPPNYTLPSLKSQTQTLTTTSKNLPQFYAEHYFPAINEVPAYGLLSKQQLPTESLKSQIHSKPEYLTILTYNVWF